MIEVSIIIPTYNRAQFLDLTLCGFSLQGYRDFEVIVIDDGGSDNTKDIVAAYNNDMHIRYLPQEKLGRGIARNTGLENTLARFVIFCDDDRIPCKDFVEKHVAALEKNNRIVTIGEKHELISFYDANIRINHNSLLDLFRKNPISYKKMVLENQSSIITKHDLRSDIDGTLSSSDLGATGDNRLWLIEKCGADLGQFHMPWILCTTANMGFDREENRDLRFDSHFSGWGMEDTDFAYQLYMNANSFAYLEDAKNFHQVHPRPSQEWDELNVNLRYFCEKYQRPETDIFHLFLKEIVSLEEASELVSCIKSGSSKETQFLARLSRFISRTSLTPVVE